MSLSNEEELTHLRMMKRILEDALRSSEAEQKRLTKETDRLNNELVLYKGSAKDNGLAFDDCYQQLQDMKGQYQNVVRLLQNLYDDKLGARGDAEDFLVTVKIKGDQ